MLRADFFDSDSFFENEMRAKLEQSRLANAITVSTLAVAGAIVAKSGGRDMKNGLYSIHIHMLDGVKGRDSGVLVAGHRSLSFRATLKRLANA